MPEQTVHPKQIDALKRQNETLREALATLMGEPDASVTELPDIAATFNENLTTNEVTVPQNGDPDGKREAVFEYAVREFKHRGRQGGGVALTAKEVSAAAGCSRSYAYTLIDDMADAYAYCHADDDPIRLKIDRDHLNERSIPDTD